MTPALRAFLRSYVLPALFIFALPAFAFWFAGHAVRTYDERAREAALESVAQDKDLSESDRASAREFYTQTPLSSLCLSEDNGPLSEGLQSTCSDYAQFAGAHLAAKASLGLGALSLLVILGCAALSFWSRTSQYVSFVVGWNFLRVAGALQTVGQGGLAVWLSYWMTALWFERYFVKLIFVAAAVAGVAIFLVLKAIFRSTREPLVIEGELVRQNDAPEFWQKVRTICQSLQTAPPDQIIGGIDDNFFVVESEVRLDNQTCRGRTLYVSLPLLRTLRRSEADAVLAHEMAHFSGGDTAHSNKLAARLSQFRAYLQALHEGGISRPIYFFMLLYWALFQLSLGRSSREREFRADRIASEATSPDDIARSLVKVAAYSSYRGRVEESLFETNEVQADLDIAGRVALGFSSYASSPKLHEDVVAKDFPHPFDTHPPLEARIQAVGAQLSADQFQTVLSEAVDGSWVSAIGVAERIEHHLWSVYETRFTQAHESSLAHRYRPANDSERAVVEKYFAPVEIRGVQDGPLLITYRGLELRGSEVFVEFGQIKNSSINDRLFKKYLDLKLHPGAPVRKISYCISQMEYDCDAFLALFNRYYGRHLIMENHQSAQVQSS